MLPGDRGWLDTYLRNTSYSDLPRIFKVVAILNLTHKFASQA